MLSGFSLTSAYDEFSETVILNRKKEPRPDAKQIFMERYKELAIGKAISVGGTLSEAKSPDQWRAYFKCNIPPGLTKGSPIKSTPASSKTA